MKGQLWVLACLLYSLNAFAHTHRSPQRITPDSREVGDLSNGERVVRGLPLKKPVRKGTPRYHALQPRASGAPGSQNVVMEAVMGGMVRRAGQYIAFDSSRNAFRITSDVGEAASFSVPAATVGFTQVRLYTSDGLYFMGVSANSATTSSTSFFLQGTSTSDLGSPSSHQTQTTIWSFAGIPGSLTGTFFALNTTSTLYLSIDPQQYIMASSVTPSDPSTRVSLNLISLDSIGSAINTVTAPTNGGTPPTGEDEDPALGLIDTALNTGAGGDEEALLKLLDCLGGLQTPECDVLLASLTPLKQG